MTIEISDREVIKKATAIFENALILYKHDYIKATELKAVRLMTSRVNDRIVDREMQAKLTANGELS